MENKNIMAVFEKLTKQQTYSEIATLSGVSRTTINNVRKNPERTRLQTLRRIFKAMGYNLVLTLEELDKEKELND